MKAKWQERGTSAVGEEAEVAMRTKPWEARATGSGAGIHRTIGSATFVRCGEQNRASEK
jgi:hypothetical protein